MKKIKKRLILSRHGLRYPLFNKDKMEKTLGEDIINWDYSSKNMGVLTKKGEVIEHLFGQELKEILNITKKDKIRFICNSMKRTYATARLLQIGISPFKHFDIDILDDTFEKMDTRYNILFNEEQLLDYDKVSLTDIRLEPVYDKIEKLFNLKENTIKGTPTRIYLDETGYLHVRGALRYATDISDVCILKYYENFKYEDIFKSDDFMKDLKTISVAKDEFLDLIFGDRKYIEESKENIYKLILEELQKEQDKLTIIVGHDSNIATLFEMFNVKYTMNENMIEKYPIGAKVLIELYEDDTYDLSYIYYHYEDIRNIKYSKPIVEKIGSGSLNGRNYISDNK